MSCIKLKAETVRQLVTSRIEEINAERKAEHERQIQARMAKVRLRPGILTGPKLDDGWRRSLAKIRHESPPVLRGGPSPSHLVDKDFDAQVRKLMHLHTLAVASLRHGDGTVQVSADDYQLLSI